MKQRRNSFANDFKLIADWHSKVEEFNWHRFNSWFLFKHLNRTKIFFICLSFGNCCCLKPLCQDNFRISIKLLFVQCANEIWLTSANKLPDYAKRFKSAFRRSFSSRMVWIGLVITRLSFLKLKLINWRIGLQHQSNRKELHELLHNCWKLYVAAFLASVALDSKTKRVLPFARLSNPLEQSSCPVPQTSFLFSVCARRQWKRPWSSVVH